MMMYTCTLFQVPYGYSSKVKPVSKAISDFQENLPHKVLEEWTQFVETVPGKHRSSKQTVRRVWCWERKRGLKDSSLAS